MKFYLFFTHTDGFSIMSSYGMSWVDSKSFDLQLAVTKKVTDLFTENMLLKIMQLVILIAALNYHSNFAC